jgi:hypothetical protein
MSTEGNPASRVAEDQFARSIIGVWTRRAVPRGWADNRSGTEYKFFAENHWVVTHHDATGFAVYAHGGTYDLVRDKYAETFTFSTLYNARMIGLVINFKIDVDGDKYMQVGLDNEYTETWTRESDGQESQVARELVGAWARVATSDNRASNMNATQYRFFGGKHWIALDANKAGLVLIARGGTFDVEDDNYTEKVTYSTQFSAYPIGKVTKSQVVVNSDTLLLSSVDDQRTEKWKRAKRE